MIADGGGKGARAGRPGRKVCVAGDTPADIAAARANHLPVIAVATGNYSFEQLMEHAPDVCAANFAALLEAEQAR